MYRTEIDVPGRGARGDEYPVNIARDRHRFVGLAHVSGVADRPLSAFVGPFR